MILSNDWEDYEILETGDGMKKERWGDVVLVRPRDADGAEETAFNSKHHATFRRVLQGELGIHVISWFFDGISKEQKWMFGMLVDHMRSKEADRLQVTAGGADIRHSVKALRNAMVFWRLSL